MSEIDRLIRSVKDIERYDKVEGAALQTVHNATDIRIFERGKGVRRVIGKYAPETKKIRRKKGLRTDTVVLEYTGQMRQDWKLSKIKPGIWESSFHNPENVRKATDNQKRFRLEIFSDLTKREENIILPKAFDAALKRFLPK